MEQQHSPLVLQGVNQRRSVLLYVHLKKKPTLLKLIPRLTLPSGHDLGGPLVGGPCIPGGTPAGPGGGMLGPTMPESTYILY